MGGSGRLQRGRTVHETHLTRRRARRCGTRRMRAARCPRCGRRRPIGGITGRRSRLGPGRRACDRGPVLDRRPHACGDPADALVSDRVASTPASKVAKGDRSRMAARPGARGRPEATAEAPVSHIGKVFFTLSGRNYVCSANSVSATNSSVVATAGHCVTAARASSRAAGSSCPPTRTARRPTASGRRPPSPLPRSGPRAATSRTTPRS